MKKLIFSVSFLVCFIPSSFVRAVIVDVNEDWSMVLFPGDSVTCVSYFIPDSLAAPNVPDSLIFTQPPQWTNSIPFDYNSQGWDTELIDAGKTVCLFGPEITNDSETDWLFIFSYILSYQWDTEDVVDYPVYLDLIVFNRDNVVYESSRWGTPGSPYEYGDPLDGPYENPVPEPMTVCILTLGTAILMKRR
jgi:hypothetical protein